MQNGDKILFSDRFQVIYDHLGVFSYIYVGNGCKGIDRQAYIAGARSDKRETQAVIELLEEHNILIEREGSLHLDLWRFHSMTVWDLLVIAESWLGGGDTLPDADPRYEPLKRFLRSENLSMTYTCP
ncbi:MAG: hypothetical protein LIO77_09390 [Rikenellaceae bacterium]|nr:hypothetical protein [Rikenellaceae bacterium]